MTQIILLLAIWITVADHGRAEDSMPTGSSVFSGVTGTTSRTPKGDPVHFRPLGEGKFSVIASPHPSSLKRALV